MGIPVSDLAAGLYLSFGILVALHERERTGEGQWVQTSLLEAMIGMMDFQITRWTVEGEVPAQEGNHHPTIVPMGCFRTADGYMNVGGGVGPVAPQLLRGDRAARPPEGPALRLHREAIREPRRAQRDRRRALATRTTNEWVEAFAAVGVPAGPVYRVDEALLARARRGVVARADLQRRGADSARTVANTKGTVLVEAVKALLPHRERAVALLPPKLAAYFDQRIVLASWYLLEDYASCCARSCGSSSAAA